jgi:hypothetical protein
MQEMNYEDLEKRILELEVKTEQHKRDLELIVNYIDKHFKSGAKTQWLDGPIMMYGKHNIKPENINDLKL